MKRSYMHLTRKHFTLAKIILALSIFTMVFWVICFSLRYYMYDFILTGALYETFAIPMMLLMFGLPALSLYFWARKKFNLRSEFFASLLINIGLLAYFKWVMI